MGGSTTATTTTHEKPTSITGSSDIGGKVSQAK
jgi:hypothetical protein